MAKKRRRKTVDSAADQNAERNLLSLMISEPGEIGKVIEKITADAFYYPAHKTIYNAIVTLGTEPWADGQGPISQDAIRNELKRTGSHTDDDTDAMDARVGPVYLQHVIELAPPVADVVYYVDLVLEHSKDRELSLMGEDIEKIAGESGRSSEKIQRIQERILHLDTLKANKSVVGLGDDLLQQARSLHGDSPARVDSGLIALDYQTGGFYPGDLVVIGARPAMGKTSLALNIALNAALAGTGVLFISLEMTAAQLRNRALCMLAGLSLSEVRHNPDLDSAKRETLFETADRYEKQKPPLFIATVGHTPAEQSALLKQYRQGHNIGLVVIDYFQLMITDHRQQNLRHMATELSRAIKRTAQTEDVPIILTSQLSPEPEGRKNVYPQLADLQEFGTVDQDADLIMLLYRQDYHRRKDKSYGSTVIFEVDIAKHRNGPTGHVKLMFDKEKMVFKDCIGIL